VASLLSLSVTAAGQVVFDSGAATPLDEKQVLPQYIGFRPSDGQVCEVNPPRFSWPYVPGVLPPVEGRIDDHAFTLQIASDRAMKKLAVDDTGLKINFYNALPVLRGGKQWYWRVGYDVGTDREKWSRVRSFTLAEGAVDWDRTILKNLGRHLRGHPRVLMNADNTPKLLAAMKTNPQCRLIADTITARARSHLRSRSHGRLPASDKKDGGWSAAAFARVGEGVETCAWAFTLTGDRKYLAAKTDALRIASYPPGGVSTPEGALAPRGQDKWSTKLTRSLAVFLDRCWDELTESERKQLIDSLDWRIRANTRHFSWRKGRHINPGGLAVWPRSHQYQGAIWTLAGDVAVYEHSAAAREHAWITLNYLIGVTGGAGDYESYNEGAGYGNWKFETTMLTTLLWNLTIPGLHLERNPYYARVGDFLSRLSPVGTYRSSFGNQGYTAYADMHETYFRELAMLTGRGQFHANWQACREWRRRSDNHLGGRQGHLPTEYVMLATQTPPPPRVEEHPTKLFNISGWVMTGSHPQSSYKTWTDLVGMTFHCRPRGGYSHSFKSENAFDLFAYGKLIAVGGATARNQERLQHDTMSHNTVLIDGNGQVYDVDSPRNAFAGRIIAFAEKDGIVYVAGDATWAYPRIEGLTHCIRHVLFVDGKYFLIFDDIGKDASAKPSRYTWLWHFLPKLDLDYDEKRCELRYAMDDVNVKIRHVGNEGDLEYRTLIGPKQASRNPFTGKDYYDNLMRGAKEKKTDLDKDFTQTNIWLTTVQPSRTGQFLAVVTPWKRGMDEPRIEVRDSVVSVIFPGLRKRTFAFTPKAGATADVVVDVEDIRRKCSNNALKYRIRLPDHVTRRTLLGRRTEPAPGPRPRK